MSAKKPAPPMPAWQCVVEVGQRWEQAPPTGRDAFDEHEAATSTAESPVRAWSSLPDSAHERWDLQQRLAAWRSFVCTRVGYGGGAAPDAAIIMTPVIAVAWGAVSLSASALCGDSRWRRLPSIATLPKAAVLLDDEEETTFFEGTKVGLGPAMVAGNGPL